MFKDQANNTTETDTIIGPSVRVEGDFITEGNIVVEGTVCGKIKTEKNIKVGPKSKIFASVYAENALISGEVQGNIRVKNKLELTPTAKIFGDIKTNILLIASGSILNGKCQMGDNKSKSPKPDFSQQRKINIKKLGGSSEPKKEKVKGGRKKKKS